ncbi:hypothetical protein [Gemelliphila palaticanis]|uniref:Uncharacterized protein n=1 Tax=Gemelliphila palaticanis TaxID=81950 RepID=A0ABX2T1J1_9BACL|nr:hypothetical protein [Gemella palaticanis]MBF0716116.1 hypothetical protein [Gemella palaticanis]NYS48046.1 hypothetical protein [Gemella palaticanis]
MKIMVRPSKEILIFTRTIRPHLKNIITGKVPKVVFKDDTPKEILDKFNDIKNKIGYELNT